LEKEKANAGNCNSINADKNAEASNKNNALDSDLDNPNVSSETDNKDTMEKELGNLSADAEQDTTLKGYIADLQTKKTGLETTMGQISDKENALKTAKKALGENTDAGYLERVQAYNKLVDEYNKLIDTYSDQITNYNNVIKRYNDYKDELSASVTNISSMGNLDESLAFKQFYNKGTKLDHMDVKTAAASHTDAAGKIMQDEYTVVGVYRNEQDKKDGKNMGISYVYWDAAAGKYVTRSYDLKKRTDAADESEFTRYTNDESAKNLNIDWNNSSIQFYVELKDKNGNISGFTVDLNSSVTYPERTYYLDDSAYWEMNGNGAWDYRGTKAYSLKKYRDKTHQNGLNVVEIDGKRYYDISGLSVYAVSAMTCDRFFWDETEAGNYDGNGWWSGDTRLLYPDEKTYTESRAYEKDKDGNGILRKANGLDLVLDVNTLISIAQRDNLTCLKYREYLEKIAPTAPVLQELAKITLTDYKPVTETTAETLDKLEAVTPLTDYNQTAEAKLNEVLQQMKQLLQELIIPDVPETPDEPTPEPTPVPVTPETPEEPEIPEETPVSPAEAPETPAADTPVMPGDDTAFVEDVHTEQTFSQHSESTLPQTGVNRAGVLGLALAGFSFLTAGLSMEISARRGKHCKR